ncbi:MAG: hypothetical protein Q8K97_17740 [Pseudohongiella sp.]|nr:hypothetical protein [Pseudohongiella sp.]
MNRMPWVVIVVLSGCVSQNQTSHYNHLRLNAPIDPQSRIEYRDLTRSYPVVDTGPFITREPSTEPVLLDPVVPTMPEETAAGEAAIVELMPALDLIVPEQPQHFCRDEFVFEIGMLRQNLSEALGSCGYVMGEWDLGDEDYLIDFPVRGRFAVPIAVGIDDVLRVVKTEFGVSASVNEITRTVDFYRTPLGAAQ